AGDGSDDSRTCLQCGAVAGSGRNPLPAAYLPNASPCYRGGGGRGGLSILFSGKCFRPRFRVSRSVVGGSRESVEAGSDLSALGGIRSLRLRRGEISLLSAGVLDFGRGAGCFVALEDGFRRLRVLCAIGLRQHNVPSRAAISFAQRCSFRRRSVRG